MTFSRPKPRDNQHAFDLVCARAKDLRHAIDGRCLYRAPDELECFVGTMLPDELYKAEFDHPDINTSVGMIVDQTQDFFENVSVTLLSQLQRVHDNHITDNWPTELEKVAGSFGLTFTP